MDMQKNTEKYEKCSRKGPPKLSLWRPSSLIFRSLFEVGIQRGPRILPGSLLDHFWMTFGPLLDDFWITFGVFLVSFLVDIQYVFRKRKRTNKTIQNKYNKYKRRTTEYNTNIIVTRHYRAASRSCRVLLTAVTLVMQSNSPWHIFRLHRPIAER